MGSGVGSGYSPVGSSSAAGRPATRRSGPERRGVGGTYAAGAGVAGGA